MQERLLRAQGAVGALQLVQLLQRSQRGGPPRGLAHALRGELLEGLDGGLRLGAGARVAMLRQGALLYHLIHQVQAALIAVHLQPAREQLQQQHAEGVHLRRLFVAVALHVDGAHVAGRAEGGAARGRHRAACRLVRSR